MSLLFINAPSARLMRSIHLHFKTFPHFPVSVWLSITLQYLGPSSLHSSKRWMASSKDDSDHSTAFISNSIHNHFGMLHVKAIREQQGCQTTSKVNSWEIITTSINLWGCSYWKIYLGPVCRVSYYSCIIKLSLMKYFMLWQFLIQMISRTVC